MWFLGVAPVALAAGPAWDWQATFVLDGAGDITSRTLDFSSDDWITCTTDWIFLGTLATPTTNTTKADIIRVDTAGQYKGHVHQENSLVKTSVWSCVGSQIPLPTADPPGDNSCNVGLLGEGCDLTCTAGNQVIAHIVTGVTPSTIGYRLHAHCGGADAHCPNSIFQTTTCEEHANAVTSGTSRPGCIGNPGIYVSAHCHA
jgi:hypothetical protein